MKPVPSVVALEAVAEALEAIRTSNGYATDAGASLHWWKRSASEALPRIHILPGEIEYTQHKRQNGAVKAVRSVAIEIIDNADGGDHQGDVLLAELEHALLAMEVDGFPGELGMLGMEFVSAEVIGREEGKNTTGATLTVSLIYSNRAVRA